MFRFSIRDVLWLTVLVRLACGWWLDRNDLRKQKSEAVNRWAQKLSDATNRPVGVSDRFGEYTVRPKNAQAAAEPNL